MRTHSHAYTVTCTHTIKWMVLLKQLQIAVLNLHKCTPSHTPSTYSSTHSNPFTLSIHTPTHPHTHTPSPPTHPPHPHTHTLSIPHPLHLPTLPAHAELHNSLPFLEDNRWLCGDGSTRVSWGRNILEVVWLAGSHHNCTAVSCYNGPYTLLVNGWYWEKYDKYSHLIGQTLTKHSNELLLQD